LAEGEGSRFFVRAPTRGEAFDILTNDGTDPISGEFSEGDNVVGMFDGHTYGFHIDYDFNADGGAVGNDIRLTAVPEPATWLLMGLGGLIVLVARPLRRAMAWWLRAKADCAWVDAVNCSRAR
jgi:hypothetical protein